MEEIDFEKISLKKLDKTELITLVSWAEKEGWNPGPHDAEVFYNTDPDGHYGFFLNGEIIAGGSVVSYSGQFGFMGLFIVKPEYRSSGVGRKLWYLRRDLLLSRLVKGAAIGMDGVVAMQPFYSKGGFVSAFRDERHEIKGALYANNPHVSVINQNEYHEIIDYDSICFGLPRPQFLVPWLNIPGNVNLKYNAGGHLNGFVVMRKAQTGYKIGPLFADDAVIAQALYEACLSAAPGEAVFLDISSENVAAVEMTKRFNTRFVFECARMYYGKPPDFALNKVFGITTFELG